MYRDYHQVEVIVIKTALNDQTLSKHPPLTILLLLLIELFYTIKTGQHGDSRHFDLLLAVL